jgi:hypothetical protein
MADQFSRRDVELILRRTAEFELHRDGTLEQTSSEDLEQIAHELGMSKTSLRRAMTEARAGLLAAPDAECSHACSVPDSSKFAGSCRARVEDKQARFAPTLAGHTRARGPCLVREGARPGRWRRRRRDRGARGMRASEITSRRVSDLDQDRAPGDLLWIPCSKTPAGRRTLEVPEVLRPMLVACCEGKAFAAFIFETEAGGAHWRDWILHNVHRICDLAEVPRVTAHAMRGLLATLTAERGLAGHVIAATLGHEDERVTMTAYARPGAAAAGANRRGLVLLEGGLKGR